MNVLLLYNPKSGNRNFHTHLDYIIEKFQEKGLQIIPYRMSTYENLEIYLKTLDYEKIIKIIISGGDGTIHQVINRLMKLEISCPLAIFPSGTANDFSQYFQIPKDIAGMVNVALTDQYVPCDLGVANDEYFINVASFGNLVDISQRVNEQFKNIVGVLAYYMKGIEEIPKLKAFQAKVTVDGLLIDEWVYFVLVMNGNSAGGFRKLAPYSDISDGLLDVLIFKKCPIFEVMPLLIQVWNGEHPKSDYIHYVQAKHVNVTVDEQITSDLDGETGPKLPLNITVEHGAINVNSLLASKLNSAIK